jgi:serine/threonine protein kinase, bacterial
MFNPLTPGLILTKRYRIVRQLGYGGFGRTYLVEDNYRFNELCVLKQFAPQSNDPYVLQKSQELFEREANVLYQLKHHQIPRFRETFQETFQNQVSLFLVQEYVAGKNYRTLLEERQQRGLRFNESECKDLLLKLLPVLEYIHSLGVIHRDISPENLILRQGDGLPVLIDFGGVKQVAVTLASEFGNVTNTATRLGKMGYAPEEQMRAGKVFPHSDLYALAATNLVLLTGKEPQLLIDPQTLKWNWHKECSLSPQFAQLLEKMLAYPARDRVSSASQVLQFLQTGVISSASEQNSPTTQPPPELNNGTQNTISHNVGGTVTPVTPVSTVALKSSPPFVLKSLKILLVIVVIIGMGTVGWLAGNTWYDRLISFDKITGEGWRDRVPKLGINERFFISLVDEIFDQKYPELGGRSLGEDTSDKIWRDRWHETANNVLKKLASFPDHTRGNLGKYDYQDLTQWKKELKELHLSRQALYNLADGQFFHLFPEQSRDQNLMDQPIGQVWLAITGETLKSLQNGHNLEELKFEQNSAQKTVSGTLQPGGGKAYIAYLKKGQNLQVQLETASSSTRFYIYTPGNPETARSLLESSKEVNWYGKLDDFGYYEFIIVSEDSSALSYQLKLMTN